MEAALQTLAYQAHVKSVGEKPNVLAVAKTWGVPKSTLERYYKNPNLFSSGVVSGARPVFTAAQEEQMVNNI